MGQRFCASVVLLISAFMIFAFVQPAIAQDGQPPENECPICHEQFSSGLEALAHHYLTHFKEHNPPSEAAYCLRCGMKFSTADEVANHILTAHAGEAPPSETYCPFCGAQVTTAAMPLEESRYEMYVHWSTVHDWWPKDWEPPEGWWPEDLRPPSDWTPPETWEVPENLLEDVIPPWMPSESWERPENWMPREDWVPSESWMPSPDQSPSEWMPENLWAEPPSGFEKPENILPTDVPQWIDTKEENYHWVPPENKPFWTWQRDNVTTDASVGFYITENSTPFIRPADNEPWTPAERIIENVSVGGVKMDVRENVSDVIITTLPLELEDLPEDVPPPEENFREFFQVGTNVPEYIDNVEIGFKVDQDWIATNNLDKDTITVEQYADMIWNPLTTTIKGEDENFLFLEIEGLATILSLFAVTVEPAAAEVPPAAEIPIVAVVGVVIGILAAAFIIMRLRRRTR